MLGAGQRPVRDHNEHLLGVVLREEGIQFLLERQTTLVLVQASYVQHLGGILLKILAQLSCRIAVSARLISIKPCKPCHVWR
jgi:hypothetical protein